jgi:hypothetical protein
MKIKPANIRFRNGNFSCKQFPEINPHIHLMDVKQRILMLIFEIDIFQNKMRKRLKRKLCNVHARMQRFA